MIKKRIGPYSKDQQYLNISLPKEQYLIEKASISFDYSMYSNYEKTSNLVSFLRPKVGKNHIEAKHPEFVEKESNYLQMIIHIVNSPSYIAKDIKHGENRVNILYPTLQSHKYYHLSLLLHPQENRILSCRYQTIVNLDKKIASKGYKGFMKIIKK